MANIHIIRRMVATMANRLKKMGLTLSAAFKRAWELVKSKAIRSRVYGVTKGNRQRALERIATRYSAAAVKVRLERDKANIHDNNAVKVIINVNGSVDYTLGYIPRNLAYIIAALLDKGMELTAAFNGVTGHYTDNMSYGAAINVTVA